MTGIRSGETPTLVLLPGMDGTGELFAPFLDALGRAAAATVVRYPPDPALGLVALAELTRAELPDDRPYVLVAESFSGPVAILLAAGRPAGLRAVVLCSTFARSPVPGGRALRWLVSAFPLRAVPVGLASLVLLARFGGPDVRELLARTWTELPAATLRSRLRAVLSIDVSPQLASIAVPILVLRGSHDRLVPAAESRRLATLATDAEAVTLEGPHLLLQAVPERAAAEIGRFVGRIGGSNPPPRPVR